MKRDDLQKNSRLGVTLALPVNRHHSVKLYSGTGMLTRAGSAFNTLGIAWQYRWGGGLSLLAPSRDTQTRRMMAV